MSVLRKTFADHVKQAGKALSLTGAAAALAFTPVSSAIANDDAPQMTQVAATDVSSNSPISQARRYSQQNSAVAVLVYGSAPNISGTQIGEHLTSELADRNVEARYFVMEPNADSIGITYFLGGSVDL